jgi:hypothetical protein
MIKYLKSHYGNRHSSMLFSLFPSIKFLISNILNFFHFIVNANERLELNFLREEVSKLRKLAGVRYLKKRIIFSLKSVDI